MNEGTKNVIKVSLTALFLVLCAMIPFWFRPAETILSDEPEPAASEPLPYSSIRLASDYDERVAIYNAYTSGALRREELNEAELTEAEYEALGVKLEIIVSSLIGDTVLYGVSEGGSFFTVTDESGAYIRVMNYYMKLTNDWENWLDVVIDIDTEDIYYIYTSCACQNDFESYLEIFRYHEVYDIALFLEAYTGFSLSEIKFEGLAGEELEGEVFTITLRTQNGFISYEIDGFTTIEPTYEVILFDYKIRCKDGANLMQDLEISDAIAW